MPCGIREVAVGRYRTAVWLDHRCRSSNGSESMKLNTPELECVSQRAGDSVQMQSPRPLYPSRLSQCIS